MKKTLSMGLAGLLVLVMASPLFAADIKITGQTRFRYRYWQNITLDKDINTQAAGSGFSDRNYFDFRARMGVDAKLSEGVRIRLEIENLQNFGEQPRNVPNATGASDVFFRQAYADFQVPGLPEGWRLQLGRSFFSLGHQYVWGNSLTGEDGATIYGPLGPGNLKIRFAQLGQVGASTNKLGGSTTADTYAEAISWKGEVAEKQNVEIYLFAQQDKAIGTITNTTKTDGSSIDSSSEFWVGGAYSGVAGPLALRSEFAYQGGTARSDATNSAGLTEDIDRSAYFLWGDVTYKIIPAWSVSLDFSYASGDGNPNDQDMNNFVGPAAAAGTSPTRTWTDSGFFFGNYTGRGIGNAATNRVYSLWGRGTKDSDVTGAGAGTVCGIGGTHTSCADDGVSAFSPGLMLLKFKTKYAFNKQVTGFLEIAPAWAAKSPNKGGSDISSYLGTEIDLKVAYKPYPNISMNGYFGYFEPGSFYDQGGALLASSSRTAQDGAYVFRAEVYGTF